MKPEDRGAKPLRKLHADPDASKAIEKAAGQSPELVATLAKMSDEERTVGLIKAVQCLGSAQCGAFNEPRRNLGESRGDSGPARTPEKRDDTPAADQAAVLPFDLLAKVGTALAEQRLGAARY
jgi:hypothetical protein